MNPCGQEDDLFRVLGLGALVVQFLSHVVSHRNNMTGSPFNGITEFLKFEVILQKILRSPLHDRIEVVFKVIMGVRLEVAEEDYVFVIFKGILKA